MSTRYERKRRKANKLIIGFFILYNILLILINLNLLPLFNIYLFFLFFLYSPLGLIFIAILFLFLVITNGIKSKIVLYGFYLVLLSILLVFFAPKLLFN